jgi:outer membrane protein TolC
MHQTNSKRIVNHCLALMLGMTAPLVSHSSATWNYNEFMQSVLSSNPRIKEAASQIKGKAIGVQAVQDSWKPSFSVDGDSTSRSGGSGASGTVRMPLFTFGKTEAELAAAMKEQHEQQARYIQVIEDVSEEVTLTYANYYILNRKVTVARRNYTDHLKILKRSEERKQAELVADGEHKSLQSRVLQAKSKVQELGKDLTTQHQKLENYLQQKVAEFTPMEDSDIYFDKSSASIDKNPLVRLYQSKVELAEAEIAKATKLEAPTLEAYVSQGTSGVNYSNSGSRVGVRFNYQFGQAGSRSRNAVELARNARDSAELAMHNARMDAQTKLDVSAAALTSIEDRIQNQVDVIEALEASAASVSRLYFAGRKSLLELLNIQRELSDARLLLVDLESEKISNYIRVRAAAGVLAVRHKANDSMGAKND